MRRTAKDLRGVEFGRLRVVGPGEPIRAGLRGPPRATWVCECDCRSTICVRQHDLLKGRHTSCGTCEPARSAGDLTNRPDRWFVGAHGQRQRDLANWPVGDLTVVAPAERPSDAYRHYNGPFWSCKCICGVEVIKPTELLYYSGRPSCTNQGAHSLRLMLGKAFGSLIVLARSGSKWLCKCKCGSTKRAHKHELQRGIITACDTCRSDNAGGRGGVRLKATAAAMRKHPHYAVIGPHLKSLGIDHQFEEIVDAYIFDLALPTVMTLVEFDGPSHNERSSIEYDLLKTRAAERLGWAVVRVSVPEGKASYPISVLNGLPLVAPT